MKKILTLLIATLLCGKQITSYLIIPPFNEVPPNDPKYRSLIVDALSKVGERIDRVTLVSLYEKAFHTVGRLGSYKLTFEKKDNTTCFIEWRVIPIVGTKDVTAPTCVGSKYREPGKGIPKVEKNLNGQNLEKSLLQISVKLDVILKKLSKLGSQLELGLQKILNATQESKLDVPLENLSNDWIAEYLRWKLKKEREKQENLTSNKTTQKPQVSRTTQLDVSQGTTERSVVETKSTEQKRKHSTHETTHVPQTTHMKVPQTTQMEESQTTHMKGSKTIQIDVPETTQVGVSETTGDGAGWWGR